MARGRGLGGWGRGREWVPGGGSGALERGEEISEEEAFPCRRGRVILGLEGQVRKEGLLAWEEGLDLSGETSALYSPAEPRDTCPLICLIIAS